MSDERDYRIERLFLQLEEELDEYIEDNDVTDENDSDLDQYIWDMCDSSVPVYNYDRAMYLAHNLWLGGTEPETDVNDRDIWDIIGIGLFDAMRDHAYTYARQTIENRNEEREYQLTEEEA